MTKKAQHPSTTRSAISEPTLGKQRVFVFQAHELAQMFTQPAWHDPSKVGKYLEGGLKPIEAFCGDIQTNLTYWAIEGEAIFYRTTDFWYMFQLTDVSRIFNELEGDTLTASTVVWMTRHRNGSSERLDDWANLHSVEHIGRKFLLGYPDKRVPLFNS